MRLHRLALPLAAALVALMFAQPAHANIMIIIDKSAQKMTVTVNGEERYVWPVSTGHSGYDTPSGEFQPFRMERDHYSQEWDDAPMPNSIFFTKIGQPSTGRSRPVILAGQCHTAAYGFRRRTRPRFTRWSKRKACSKHASGLAAR